MPDKKYTFRKSERLCNKKIITELFNYQETQVISEYPFLLKWLIKNQLDSPFPAQIIITVSRKYSNKAVKRNRIRRQIREMYRINKNKIYEVLEPQKIKLAILLIFTGKEVHDFDFLNKKFEILIAKFIKNIQQAG